uniref:Podocin n=1 Tax=Phallusia mammillata TaxID=59560 RepID=A0A6F9DU42_9ASCI|nr:stomatin-like protein 1 [Phallusia mammillata]
MKYTSLNKINKPLDFRSHFTYGGMNKTNDYDETYEPSHNQEDFPRSSLDCLCTTLLTGLSYFICCITFPFSAIFTFKLVNQYERILVYRLGHLLAPKGPGFVFILPCIDKYNKVDLRTKAFNVPPTNVRTTDACIISIGAVIHFRIRNPVLMSLSAQNVNHGVRDAARASMANLLSKQRFSDIKNKKQVFAYDIQMDVNTTAKDWGVEIGSVELSDITLIMAPPEQQSPFMPMYGAEPTPTDPTMDTLGHLAKVGQHFIMNHLQQKEQEPVPVPEVSSADFKTAEELFELVEKSITSQLVDEVDASFQFEVSGNGGGEYYLDLKNSPGVAGRGCHPGGDVDVLVKLNAENLQKLMSGQMTPYTAYSSGRLKLEGDLRKAMKLDKVLSQVAI